jgi:hypothetical protein
MKPPYQLAATFALLSVMLLTSGCSHDGVVTAAAAGESGKPGQPSEKVLTGRPVRKTLVATTSQPASSVTATLGVGRLNWDCAAERSGCRNP